MFKGYSLEFEDFWRAYPRRIAKGAAWNAWRKLQPDIDLRSLILASIREHLVHDPQWREVQYIPHPATFLNQRRFEDELAPARPHLSERTSHLVQAVRDFSGSS